MLFSPFHMLVCLFYVQETESLGTVVIIHDLSINGTFLNGTKIGMCVTTDSYLLVVDITAASLYLADLIYRSFFRLMPFLMPGH